MYRQLVLAMLTVVVACTIGCVQYGPNRPPQGAHAGTSGMVTRLVPQPRSPIPDLPLPFGFEMDEKNSGNWDFAGGVRFVDHVYVGKADKLSVRQFYQDQMASFQWTLVTSMFAQGVATLNFEKGTERCQISIAGGGSWHRTQIRARIYAGGASIQPPTRKTK